MTKLQDEINKKKLEEADRLREEARLKGVKGGLSDKEREEALKRMRETGIPPFGEGVSRR